MAFYCSGCNSKALSYQGYQTHLRLSQNPECRRLYNHLNSYVPSDSDSDNGTDDSEEDEQNPVAFEGDYFSPTYMPNDLGLSSDEGDGDIENMIEQTGLVSEVDFKSDEEVLDISAPQTPRQAIDERLRKEIFVEKFPSTLARAAVHQRCNGDTYYGANVAGSTENPYAPCTSKLEWEFVRWAKLRGPGATALTELLQIEGFCECLGLSFSTSKELNKLIDSLPERPCFHREEVTIAGQSFEFFYRDIQECIKALWSDPEFTPYLVFAPERHYKDQTKTTRLYHDMHTGNWWWEKQEEFEKCHPGATIIPIIISSDKMQVTLFRNKTAYPVYMTIGNLPKFIRWKPS
ncbi:hypothetical protein E1B28_008045 [Marasmius oreades]|uniref:Uncharacterized protein n=1 Tax=Marasmius oreades TaxID=181124 RepID=A0A9P7S2T9_9AGAR|nr:uncharacterized protein E1B28_008045 [Marasmius oreades]KAG7094449.1 hypothetical protein E1B28_008045 [Marasmius oreades]